MQRAPYMLPAATSLARAYRLFRGLGLHHVLVTEPSVAVTGILTRTNLTQEWAEVTAARCVRMRVRMRGASC